MLKYIGDFEKLKDYGFEPTNEFFPYRNNDNEVRYIHINPTKDTTIVIVDNGGEKRDMEYVTPKHGEIYLYHKYIKGDDEIVSEDSIIILYKLIKDGLVIKEESRDG